MKSFCQILQGRLGGSGDMFAVFLLSRFLKCFSNSPVVSCDPFYSNDTGTGIYYIAYYRLIRKGVSRTKWKVTMLATCLHELPYDGISRGGNHWNHYEEDKRCKFCMTITMTICMAMTKF